MIKQTKKKKELKHSQFFINKKIISLKINKK